MSAVLVGSEKNVEMKILLSVEDNALNLLYQIQRNRSDHCSDE